MRAQKPLSAPARWALDRLSELNENVDSIVLSGRGIIEFPRPAVPAMSPSGFFVWAELGSDCRLFLTADWYFSDFGNAVNAAPFLISPNSCRRIANMGRCFDVGRVVRGKNKPP
jgi:hypothetical protein